VGLDADGNLQRQGGVDHRKEGLQLGVDMLLEASACPDDEDTRCRKELWRTAANPISRPWWCSGSLVVEQLRRVLASSQLGLTELVVVVA
jgi:hypothetical protein